MKNTKMYYCMAFISSALLLLALIISSAALTKAVTVFMIIMSLFSIYGCIGCYKEVAAKYRELEAEEKGFTERMQMLAISTGFFDIVALFCLGSTIAGVIMIFNLVLIMGLYEKMKRGEAQ